MVAEEPLPSSPSFPSSTPMSRIEVSLMILIVAAQLARAEGVAAKLQELDSTPDASGWDSPYYPYIYLPPNACYW